MSDPKWLVSHVLEVLHRAGYTLRVEDGRGVVEHPEHEVHESLLAAVEHHHDALLKALTVGDDELERIRNATKPPGDA
jgi:hypothetical protein